MQATTLEQIEQYHALLHATFKAGTCRTLAYRRTQLYQLARMCQENAEAFADAISSDIGKPRFEALAYEVGGIVQRSLLCAERLEEWMAPEKIERHVPDWQKAWKPILYKNAKGPVLVIAPWNYPMILSLQSLYAAIAAGCPAVVKPSEFAPAYGKLLAELVPKYLDPSAYVVVNGAIPETTKLLSLRWAHIFYTGNGRVGRVVARAAAEHLTPVSLELGGKSPVIVDAEFDLRIAASRILYGKGANAGQTCVAPDYVLIPREAQSAFVEALKEVYAERYPKEEGGALGSSSYGRIVNRAHFDRLEGILRRTKGEVVIGGETDETKLKIAPTVVVNVKGDDALMEDELFGPLLPIVPVQDLDEAIEFVNARDHPLSFYAFTDRPEFKQKLIDETLSGSIIFNDTFDQLAVNELPFCGVGESGYGYQILRYGFDAFTHQRGSIDLPKDLEPNLRARYPPYTEETTAFMTANVYLPIPTLEQTTDVAHL